MARLLSQFNNGLLSGIGDFGSADFELGRYTFDAFAGVDLSLAALDTVAPADFASSGISINEFVSNAPGPDPVTMSVELRGTPGAAFSGFLVSIENDSLSSAGLADRVAAVSGTFDANGLLVVSVPDLENPSFTYVLTDNTATVTEGQDLDTNNDGTLDGVAALGLVLDAIGIPDSAVDVGLSYATQLGGEVMAHYGGTSEPEIVFRDSISGDWYFVDTQGDNTSIFDIDGNNIAASEFNTDPSVGTTFGAQNAAIVLNVWLLTAPGFQNFVQQDDSFATILGAATADDFIVVTDAAGVGDAGALTVTVDNLLIKGAAAFTADLTLDAAVADVRLVGTNTVDVIGNSLANKIIGSNGANEIDGDAGNDIINSFGGDDTIEGGAGNDILRGGTGADTFVYEAMSGEDVIVDFEDGTDLLDFTGFVGVSSIDDLTIQDLASGTNTRITAADGSTVLLKGVDAADIDAADFMFAPLVSSEPEIDGLLV